MRYLLLKASLSILALGIPCLAQTAQLIPNQSAHPLDSGHYVGIVQAKWSPDGRNMTLLEPFAYVDPQSVEWDAPTGTVTDGASIPKIFWSIIGGPFEGIYRDAAVIHDAACISRARTWEATHEMFYHAMLTSHVSLIEAKTMYAAVYYFGPRWNLTQTTFIDVDADVDALVAGIQSSVGAANSSPQIKEEIVGFAGPSRKRVTVTFVAPRNALTQSQFQTLARLIKRNEAIAPGSVSLEEIRNFDLSQQRFH